jgi:hypothetical protein
MCALRVTSLLVLSLLSLIYGTDTEEHSRNHIDLMLLPSSSNYDTFPSREIGLQIMQ